MIFNRKKISFTPTKADVANWQKQLQLKFRFVKLRVDVLMKKNVKEKKKDNQYKL